MRSDTERLKDILDAIATIRTHMVPSREEYDADEVKRWFYLKQIEIVGEASWKLTPETKAKEPGIPWDRIAGMRHILVHDYWQVDWELLWFVLCNELDSLTAKVEGLLHDAEEG